MLLTISVIFPVGHCGSLIGYLHNTIIFLCPSPYMCGFVYRVLVGKSFQSISSKWLSSFCSGTGSDVIQYSLKVSDGTKDDIELQGCPQLLSGCWVDWTESPYLVYALLKMELVNPSKQSKGHYPNPLIKINRIYFLLDRAIFLKLDLKNIP